MQDNNLYYQVVSPTPLHLSGSFPAKFIFTMLGLQTVEILSLMLPLAFYIGLLVTLGRWYQDNEMTVLAACGVGLTQLLRPVLLIAAGFAVVVAMLSFYLAPVATRLVAQIKQDDSSRASHWLRLSGRGQLWRGLYLASDLEYALGDVINGPRAFLELGWQF